MGDPYFVALASARDIALLAAVLGGRAARPAPSAGVADRGPVAYGSAFDAYAVAAAILAHPRVRGDLRALGALSAADLAEVPGVGPARARRVVAALALGRVAALPAVDPDAPLRDARATWAAALPFVVGAEVEVFLAMLLDARVRLVRVVEVARGGVNKCPIVPRDAFVDAVRDRAAAVIFVHNHPSGDPSPSPEDEDLTRRLVEVGDLLGVPALDHVVVTDDRFCSVVEFTRASKEERRAKSA